MYFKVHEQLLSVNQFETNKYQYDTCGIGMYVCFEWFGIKTK